MKLTAYIDTYSTDDGVDCPHFAIFTVDDAFLDSLKKLSGVIRDNRLNAVSIDACPDAWMPKKLVKELDLFGDEMFVSRSSFWFEAAVEHCEAIIKTRGVDLSLFMKEVEDAVAKGATELFLGADEDWLRSKVERALDRNNEDEEA